jgi:VWFA-related protein
MRPPHHVPRLALCLTLVVLAATAITSAQDFQLRVDVSLVSVDVGVYDRKGDAVTTLGKEDFLVFEDGERQEIRVFEPSSVAFNSLLIVDRSGSMRTAWDFVVEGLNRFMKVLRVQDRVAIAAFDSSVEIVSKWRSAHSGRNEKVGIAPEGRGTDFYGAVAWAAGYIKPEKGRKGVVVFSDGEQSSGGQFGFGGPNRSGAGASANSSTEFRRTIERLRQTNVPFYFVGYDFTPASAEAMRQLADASGGRAFFPAAAHELVGIYEQIGRDLGRSYSITYAPKKAADGKFRKIEVRPLDVRLRIAQSRDGYYAR